MNQDIKVTRCIECPMLQPFETRYYYDCTKGAFMKRCYDKLSNIHPNCPLKGKTITYKIGENE